MKYFIPDNASGATGHAEQHPVSAIVFPNRTDDGPLELVRVSHADALTRLAAEFCPLGGRLDAEKIERLIRWVGDMTCLEMRYARLDDGMDAIADICS